MEAIVEIAKQRTSTSHDDRIEERLPNINVALFNRVYNKLMHSWPFKPYFVWTKQDLGGFVLLRAKLDHLSIREMVRIVCIKVFIVFFTLFFFFVLII